MARGSKAPDRSGAFTVHVGFFETREEPLSMIFCVRARGMAGSVLRHIYRESRGPAGRQIL